MVLVCHDDKLILRCQKHLAGLSSDWWRALLPTGEVTGWWHPDTGEHRGARDAPPEGRGWKPCSARSTKLAQDVIMYARDAYIEVRLDNLWTDFRSRYRLGLEAVLDACSRGIIGYRGSEATPRHKQEALRNRFKRWWTVAAYEHDLVLLDAGIGESMMRELAQHQTGKAEWSTVYLKGFAGARRKDKPIEVKAYPMLEQHGVRAWKLEVTLRSEYIKRHDMRSPENWLTQPRIQSRISDTLKREWRGAFSMAPETRQRLAEAIGTRQQHVFDFMAETRNTLSDVLRRMTAVEQEQAIIRGRLSSLEKAVQSPAGVEAEA